MKKIAFITLLMISNVVYSQTNNGSIDFIFPALIESTEFDIDDKPSEESVMYPADDGKYVFSVSLMANDKLLVNLMEKRGKQTKVIEKHEFNLLKVEVLLENTSDGKQLVINEVDEKYPIYGLSFGVGNKEDSQNFSYAKMNKKTTHYYSFLIKTTDSVDLGGVIMHFDEDKKVSQISESKQKFLEKGKLDSTDVFREKFDKLSKFLTKYLKNE